MTPAQRQERQTLVGFALPPRPEIACKQSKVLVADIQ